MPALRTSGKPVHVKIKRPKPKAGPPTPKRKAGPPSPTPKAGPPTPKRGTIRAPKKQPGPVSDAETRRIVAHKKKPTYSKALSDARTHGPAVRSGTGPGEAKGDTEFNRGRKVSDAVIRAARIKSLRRTRVTGKKLITRELEGKGVLAKAFSGAADKLVTQSSDPTRRGLGLDDELGKNLAKDVITFPAQALPSVYVPAAGVVEAIKGDPKRIKKFAKDIDESDPLYNLAAAGVAKAKGNTAAAKKRLKTAKESAKEHPGLTALEVAGAKGFAGRTTSRALRGGGRSVRKAGRVTGSKRVERAGEKIRRAGSTERASRTVPGTAIVEARSYSRDSFKKAGEVLRERQARKRTKGIRKRADEAKARGDTDVAQELYAGAAKRDPDRVSDREIRRRVDERTQVNEDTRRRNRATATKTARKIVKSVPREKGALSVVAQRIVKADKKDIESYVRELTAEAESLSHSKLRANKTLRKQLQAVIDDPKANMGRLEAAAKAYEQAVGPVQKKLGELKVLDPKQIERATVTPYAIRRMGAKRDPKLGLVDKDGLPIPTEHIRAHMKANNESPAAFLTQAPSQRGAKNFNVQSSKQIQASAGKRTGEATRKGIFDADPETLVEGAAKGQGLVDATEAFRSTIKEFAVRGKTAKVSTYLTKKQADKAASDAMHDANGDPLPGAMSLRPVRVNPFAGSKAQLEKLLEDVDNLDAEQAQLIVKAMQDSVHPDAQGEGPWALIPEAAADQIFAHLNAQGGGGGIKTVQLANQAFRRTVLSTSPGWFAGNLIEGLGRAALAHAGPRSYVTGKKVLGRLREIDPAMADEALSRMTGGGHFVSADRAHVRRGAEQFSGTTLAPIANALGKFWRAPGPKTAARMWNAYTDFVFRSLNGRIETGIQTAMAGRALRKSPLMDQKILKLGRAAVDDAAKGLTKTENQIKFGREVDTMYGKYGKFSPAQKKAISTFTPFAAWWLNSVNFVYRTLPRDHPVVTGLIATAEMATEEWRKEHGLDLFIDGAVPGFLQGSIPVGEGKFRASKFTPFGAFTDPGGTIAGQVLPLWQGPAAALQGRDWTGRELRVTGEDGRSRKPNPLETFVFAARAFAEATVPGLSKGQQIGSTGVGSLSPFKVVKPKESTSTRRIRKPSESGFFGGSKGSSSSTKDGSFFGGGGSSSRKKPGGFFD